MICYDWVKDSEGKSDRTERPQGHRGQATGSLVNEMEPFRFSPEDTGETT